MFTRNTARNTAWTLWIIWMVLWLIVWWYLLLRVFWLLWDAWNRNDYNNLNKVHNTINTDISVSNKYPEAIGLNQEKNKIPASLLDIFDIKVPVVTYNDLKIFSWQWDIWADMDWYGDIVYDYTWKDATLNIVVDSKLDWVVNPVLLWYDLLNGNKNNPKLWWVWKWYFVIKDTEENRQKIYKLPAWKFKFIKDNVYIYDDDNDSWSIPAIVIIPTYSLTY